jgi:tetratricopeptide (TPR) repeat protein
MAGRDETFNTPPPGLILHAHSIRHAIQNGFRTYDFLRGNEPYKYSLATDERRIVCMIVGTRNGRNLGDRLDMRSVPAALDRATELHKSGRLKQAELAYRQIIQTDPKCAKALYYLGQLKASTGSHGAAKRLFKSLVAVSPDSEKGWLRLGHSLEARHRFKEAAEAYREVIKQQPTLALAHNKLGNALFRLGHFDDAVAAFDRALRLQSDYLEADVSRANTLYMLGRLPPEEVAHGAKLNVKLGDKIRTGGSNGFAVHCYRQALKMKSDLIEAHYGLGQALQAQGDIVQAVQSYRRVIDLKPDHRDALAHLSELAPPQHKATSVLQISP